MPAALGLGLGAVALASSQAWADPAPDPTRIFTFQVENDALAGTDRYYTSGLHLGLTLPTDQVPDPLARLGQVLFGGGQQRIALGLTQPLFTPRDTQISPPDPNDRPYAGLLLGDMALLQDTDQTRSALDFAIGVIGPAALGEEVQNGFHHFLGQTTNKGWDFQLPNQPVVEFTAERIWRMPLGGMGPFEADALPTLAAGVGLWRDYALAGGQLRIGQGLNSDFGAPRIEPGLNGWDAYQATGRFAWYIFAGGDGQAVAFDETIDGEPFGSTAHVSRTPWVGEFEAGIAVLAFGMRLTFSDVFQTHEFRSQQGGLFQFASAAISFKF